MQVFRIVSLNAWGGAVFDAFAQWLPTLEADAICLQEVTRTPDLAGWTRFEDAERSLPQRANLFADVCELLPHHIGSFAASDAGPVVDNKGHTHQQDFGLAVFVHERHSVIKQQTTFVHGEFNVHDEWKISERPRIAQHFVSAITGRTGPSRSRICMASEILLAKVIPPAARRRRSGSPSSWHQCDTTMTL
jgi:hypothetical protein